MGKLKEEHGKYPAHTRYDDGLKSHNHDAMEVTMARGSLSVPSTILVNDISTGTTAPLSVDTALSVQINNNTPSLTMLYIIRAF